MSEDDVDALAERLDDAEAALEDAAVESEHEDVATTLSSIEEDLEAADLPDPEDEDDPAPEVELSDRLDELETRLEEERGPYAKDVTAIVEEVAGTVAETRWTASGEDDVIDAVETFLDRVADDLGADLALAGDTLAAGAEALEGAAETVEAAVLDPDADAETIGTLLDAAEALESSVEDAQEWSDLTVRQQLAAEGFYEVLDHYKDYPPEWSALKEWEQRGRVDMIALAYEQLDSEFMEEHCLEAFKRMGDPAALDAIEGLIDRRDAAAIEIAGKTGSDRPVEALLEYVDEDGDPNLQLVTIAALGEIGAEAAVQPIADQLEADDERVRSRAARSLGLIGDTRSIAPLSAVLASEEADDVRASAAWALNQIGTERARDALTEYTDDGAYLVESEAAKAA
jgi:HEAT repeat protein